jgi:hypothetical protein
MGACEGLLPALQNLLLMLHGRVGRGVWFCPVWWTGGGVGGQGVEERSDYSKGLAGRWGTLCDLV